MTKVCTDCHGTGRSRTVWTKEQRFADCEACEGKGYTRELRRMTAEDVRRIVEHKPTGRVRGGGWSIPDPLARPTKISESVRQDAIQTAEPGPYRAGGPRADRGSSRIPRSIRRTKNRSRKGEDAHD